MWLHCSNQQQFLCFFYFWFKNIFLSLLLIHSTLCNACVLKNGKMNATKGKLKPGISHSTDKIFPFEFGKIFCSENVLVVFWFLVGDHVVAGPSTLQQQFRRLLIHFECTIQLQQPTNILFGSILFSLQLILCLLHRELFRCFDFVDFLWEKIGIRLWGVPIESSDLTSSGKLHEETVSSEFLEFLTQLQSLMKLPWMHSTTSWLILEIHSIRIDRFLLTFCFAFGVPCVTSQSLTLRYQIHHRILLSGFDIGFGRFRRCGRFCRLQIAFDDFQTSFQ